MKLNASFLLPAVASLSLAANAPLKFAVPPSVQVFPDGAVEWNASLKCADPLALSGTRIVFSFDFDLDGAADRRDSLALSAADCESGEAHPTKTFFPAGPGVFTAELWQGNALSDRASAFAGPLGGLLSVRHFCARPTGGEPEWIEVRNASPLPVSLAKVFFQGHLLGIGTSNLNPGESVIVGRDSVSLRQWQPGAALLTPASWSSLRNTGDTLRLTENGIVLDSVDYGAEADPREACVSTATEANVAAASGFALQVPVARWNPVSAPLEIDVQAPADGAYDLRLYDLDGLELCAVATNGMGPAQIQFSASDCRGLQSRRGSLLLQLQPRHSAPVRKLIRVSGS